MNYLETAAGEAHLLNIAMIARLSSSLERMTVEETDASVQPMGVQRYGLLPFEPEFDPTIHDEPYDGYFGCDRCNDELVGSDPIFTPSPGFLSPTCFVCTKRQLRKGTASVHPSSLAYWLRDATTDLVTRSEWVGASPEKALDTQHTTKGAAG